MGAWGTAPWDNDEAADWFSGFFKGIDADARIDEALNGADDAYDDVRAACYLLDVLGNAYVWPGDLDRLPEHLRQGIARLQRMIDPDDEDMDFLELWGHDAEVIASVRAQIAALERRLQRG